MFIISKASFRNIGKNEHTIMTALALAVGLAGGFGAVGFRYLINFFQSIAYGSSKELLAVIEFVPWYLRLLVPAAGGLMVGILIYRFAREAKGHGVPEVMEAVALKSGVIRKRIVFVKALASAICIGTGGSVGREGPIVQIGSAIGSSIGQLVRVSTDRMKTLVGCGAAAGIAATFNAPIAGTMFAIEVILGDFGIATFSPIVISSVTATAVSRHFLGNIPAFEVPAYQLLSTWEFPLYVGLGLFCAIVGVAFTKILYKTEDLFDAFKFPEYLKPVMGGFMLGGMGFLFPHILGVGYGGINLALWQTLSWWVLLVLVFYKIMATAITIGSGGSGGIFAPSLFLGAMAGGFFGTVVHQLFPMVAAPPGAYSIVGMGAVVSATTHGPISAILILFEMTGDYKIILPLMTTCIISNLFAGQFLRDSIYTLKLARRGIDIRAGKEVNVLKSIAVKDIMNAQIETIQEDMKLSALAEMISKSKFNSFPVVDKMQNLTGMLSFIDYHEAVRNEDLQDLLVTKDLATVNVVQVTPQDNLFDAFEKIALKDYSILPVVVSETNPGLLGIVTRRDIIGAYNKAVIKKTLF